MPPPVRSIDTFEIALQTQNKQSHLVELLKQRSDHEENNAPRPNLSFLTVLVVICNACSKLLGCHASSGIGDCVGLVTNSGSSEFNRDGKEPDIESNNDSPQVHAPIDANETIDVVAASFFARNVIFPSP